MKKWLLLPYLNRNTSTLFLLRRYARILFGYAISYKIFFIIRNHCSDPGNTLPIQLEAKVNEYLSLIMRLIFAFGISFQLPVIIKPI